MRLHTGFLKNVLLPVCRYGNFLGISSFHLAKISPMHVAIRKANITTGRLLFTAQVAGTVVDAMPRERTTHTPGKIAIGICRRAIISFVAEHNVSCEFGINSIPDGYSLNPPFASGTFRLFPTNTDDAFVLHHPEIARNSHILRIVPNFIAVLSLVPIGRAIKSVPCCPAFKDATHRLYAQGPKAIRPFYFAANHRRFHRHTSSV